MRYISNFPNRTLCNVLEDMRNADKTKNYSYLVGLIEELQVLANRMEAALGDKRDYNEIRDELKTAKKGLIELDKKIEARKRELEEMGNG